jgi:hypothetical protein
MEDFYKKVYHPEDKTVDAWYYIKSETPTQTTVLNVQERETAGRVWASGDIDYRLSVKEIKLPKSQIQVLSHDENRPGYFFIKIPYWLFKKNEGLEVHRISVNKKFTIRPDDAIYSKFADKDYLKAMAGAGTNMTRIDMLHQQRLEFEKPKPTPSQFVQQEIVVFKPNSRGIYNK